MYIAPTSGKNQDAFADGWLGGGKTRLKTVNLEVKLKNSE